MPISCRREDILAWGLEKDGIYSVKFGYKMLMKVENRAYNVLNENLDRRWKWVWGLDVTPMVQLFTWRNLHGIIPSNLNLITRYVNIEPACKRCGDLIESTEHAVRDCPWWVPCWGMIPFAVDRGNPDMPINEWICEVIWKFPTEGQEIVMRTVN